jgi:hypothetical protein
MKGQKLLDVIEMEVNNAVLGKEVLTIDSYYNGNKYTPCGIVGLITGIFSYIEHETCSDIVLVRIQSNNRAFELPITHVQEVLNYVPSIGDSIRFPEDSNGIINATVKGFGKDGNDYILFIETIDKESKHICINSKQVYDYERPNMYK